MNKNELVASIAERTGVKKAQVKTVLDMVGVIAAEQVSVAGGFKLPGIGGFESYDRSARLARNPRTGEQIVVPAKRSVKFRMASAIKDSA